ncbi:MAG: phytanoyl-CoA dioxygenase family protein [Bacteroidota bacterium]
MNSPKEFFDRNGFYVLKGAWSEQEIGYYKEKLHQLAAKRSKKAWTLPDGVSKEAAFWPAIFNEKVLQTVRQLIGPEACYLQHNDLHVGFSSLTWHRDSVNRTFGKGGDWDETTQPYRLLRVGTYLQSGDSGFRLGMVPGSQRPDVHLSQSQQREINQRSSTLASITSLTMGKDWLNKYAEWIRTEPGDTILFDPRILHTGSKFEGVKYSFFTAYGVPNLHFERHYNYYRHARTDLEYQALAPALVEKLRANGLYAAVDTDLDAVGSNAYIPSSTFSYIAKYFK